MASVRKQWVFDVQEIDVPKGPLLNEVISLWRNDDRLYNDVCIYKYGEDDWTFDERSEEWGELSTKEPTRYPEIEKWLLEKGVPFEEEVWIHYWW